MAKGTKGPDLGRGLPPNTPTPTRTGTTPYTAAPVSWWLNLGLQPNGW